MLLQVNLGKTNLGLEWCDLHGLERDHALDRIGGKQLDLNADSAVV